MNPIQKNVQVLLLTSAWMKDGNLIPFSLKKIKLPNFLASVIICNLTI
jgi:hypothetical protein